MAISVEADGARRLLVATVSGEVTFPDLLEFFATARSGEGHDWPMLVDITGATTEIGSAKMQRVADHVGKVVARDGHRASAAIFAPTDVSFGMARMYQTLCESRGIDVIRVFRVRAEAEAWLLGGQS